MPRMVVIAGPPGGGKSTAFPAGTFEVEFFNADDRAAMLNAGSYRAITPAVRAQVNGLFEAFVNENIRAKKSFAFETTLRTDMTLRQAADAQRSGFTVTMKYLAMGSLQDHLRRVAARAEGGGHAASSNTLGRIYDASLRNLSASIRALDDVEVFDNAAFGKRPRLVLESLRGRLTYLAPDVPEWLTTALRNTEFKITPQLRADLEQDAMDRDSSGFDQ